ncbi:MAG: Sjogren's syndrome/scleroderma autoantigen 1 family protein [Halobacteriales archaeon]
MSEDFDKEAEREKLREQFERDEERREATRKMSDLLLKGATMTNRHCDRCGNPIFRYEGQEFCAECQTTVGEEGESQASAAEGGDASAAGSTNAADGTDAEDRTVADPDETGGKGPAEAGPSTDPAATADVAEGSPDPEPSGAPSASTGSDLGHPTVRPDRDERSPRQSDSRRTPPIDSTDVPSRPETADLPDAGTALRETLTRFAARAAETDDPRQAREYLAAAREAAEALAALRR